MIECLNHAPPLVIDVISYVVVAKMAEGSARLKSDGVTVADWLQVRQSASEFVYDCGRDVLPLT